MTEQLRVAEMLCTRLCHDLTGPIGAVNNGAEFLAEEGFNLQGQAMELITSSAASAVARLQFYRMAYGRVKDQGEASLADGQRLAGDFFTGSKITLDWPDQYGDASGVALSQRMMRLLLNFIVITSAALLKGGTVSVKITQAGGARQMEVTASGEAVKWEKEIETALTQPIAIADLTPKNVQFYLTQQLAAELGAQLAFESSATAVTLRATRKAEAEAA